MKTIKLILGSIINELLIIFLFIFLINNYFGNADETIKADGVGYYDYLPSLFIHHDLVRKDTIKVKKVDGHHTSHIEDNIGSRLEKF